MNILALKGFRVKVTEKTRHSGWSGDKKRVASYLEIDKEYAIERTEIDSSSSTVILQDFPNVRFNTVNFADVDVQSEEDDAKHPYAERWNKK